MEMDRRTALLSAQKIRLMRNGNIVMLISLAMILFNAVFAVVIALSNPVVFILRGGMEMIAVFMLISAIAAIVGAIIYLVGLYGLRDIRPEYRNAFLWEIGLFIFGIVISAIGKEMFFGKVLDAVRTILSLVVAWLVIKGTGCLMESLQREDILHRGEFVWRLTAVSSILGTVYGLIPTGNQMGPRLITLLVIGVILAVFAFVAAIYYVNYLGQAAKALDQIGGTMEEAPPL